MDVDAVLQSIGGCNTYQVVRFLALSFVYMTGSWHVYAILFIGADPGHKCNIPSSTTDNSTITYPDGDCHILVEQDGHKHTESCPNGYVYGSEFPSTILTQWDLVCDQDYMVDLSTTVFMIGNACGATLVTPFSDKFGRKWVLLISLWLQGVIGIFTAFVDNYVLFVVIRFFIGFLNMAIALVCYVMVTESFCARLRTRPCIAVNLAWAIGLVLLALFGYLVRDWRYLHVLISAPKFLTVIYVCILGESIPWLVSKGKYDEVERTVRVAAKWNNSPVSLDLVYPPPDRVEDTEDDDNAHIEKPVMNRMNSIQPDTGTDRDAKPCTVLDLFRTTKMRRYTIIMFYLWFVASLGYTGILFSTPSLHGNVFINLAISGAVEIPAVLICMLLLEKVGRRKPVVVFFIICGVMNIATVFVPRVTESASNLEPVLITLAMVGKFGISGAYSTVYLYSAEIFPTCVRNQAMGLSSFFENIGGIAAPMIIYGAKNLTQMPLVLFGALTLIGGLLAICLPETHMRPLPETIAEIEQYKQVIDSRETAVPVTQL